MFRIVSLVACVVLCLGARAVADDASLSFTGSDVAQLYKAVDAIETSDGILLNISMKPAAQMPSYDLIAHYAGQVPNGKPHEAALWMSSALDSKSARHRRALHDAMELAVMDSGIAGPKWKQIYDAAASADTKLPPAEPDRYKNRHLVTQLVQNAVDALTASPKPR
jgi:hypothetical protein